MTLCKVSLGQIVPPHCFCSIHCSGTGVEARAARLGLGRVSVVRGEGRLAGTPCIDDTIRSLEPVADHLTRYSGLVRAVCSQSSGIPCAFGCPNS